MSEERTLICHKCNKKFKHTPTGEYPGGPCPTSCPHCGAYCCPMCGGMMGKSLDEYTNYY